MNHPSPEQWVSYLYRESAPAESAELDRHLSQCPECRAQLSAWRATGAELDAWSVSTPARKIRRPILEWGIAALFLVFAGFLAGRQTSPAVDLVAVRTSVERGVRQTVQADFAAAQEKQRQEFVSLLRNVEQQRLSDYRALRKDLETVAVLAEDKIERTERGLAQVAALTQKTEN